MAAQLLPSLPVVGTGPDCPGFTRWDRDTRRTYAGAVLDSPVNGPTATPGYIGDGYTAQQTPQLLPGFMVSGDPVGAPGCKRTESAAHAQQYPGADEPLPTPGSGWFGRVWLLSLGAPVQGFAFGNIVAEVNVPVTVWNAHLVQRTMVNLDFDPLDGAFLIGPDPRNFAALEAFDYTLRIPIDGPPTVDTVVAFDFDTPESPSLTVTASIAIALAFRANWAGDVEEVLEWATDVLTSWDGTEQRMKLRESPRRRFRYSWLLRDHEPKQLEALTWAWQSRAFAVPVWMDCASLQADLPQGSGTVSLPLGTAGQDWVDGGIGFLVAPDRGLDAYLTGNTPSEILQVATVSPFAITLQNPTSREWPAGSLVVPARFMRMPSEVTFNQETATVVRADVELEEVTPETSQPDPSTITTYLGDPVWPIRQNRREATEARWERTWDRLDPQVGLWVVDPRTGRPKVKRSRRFTVEGRDGIQELKEWLYYLAGRWRTVWVDTDQRDLDTPGGVGGATMTIQAIGYTSFYGTQEYRRDLVVEDIRDGSKTFHRVNDAAAGAPGLEVLTVDPAVPSIPADFARVRFIARSRMEADRVTLRWETDDTVEATVFWRSL